MSIVRALLTSVEYGGEKSEVMEEFVNIQQELKLSLNSQQTQAMKSALIPA